MDLPYPPVDPSEVGGALLLLQGLPHRLDLLHSLKRERESE